MKNTRYITRKGITIKVGDIARLTELAERSGCGTKGLKIKIAVIMLDDAYDGGTKIGIQSFIEIPNFHNLDGLVPRNTGWWLTSDEVFCGFLKQITTPSKYILKDFVYRGNNLKGKKCKILGMLSNNDYMVEFEEYIGGLSGDGLGQMGHCIPVPFSFIEEETTQKKKTHKGIKNHF